MSAFADERAPIHGTPGAGSVVVYTLGQNQRLRLETITFLLTTSNAAANRNAQIVLKDQAGDVLAIVPDYNDVAASLAVTYTFGIGLPAFCGIATSGGFVQNALPDTVLESGGRVTVESRNAATGAVVAGDTITSVILYGISDTPSAGLDVIPLLTPVALADQTA